MLQERVGILLGVEERQLLWAFIFGVASSLAVGYYVVVQWRCFGERAFRLAY